MGWLKGILGNTQKDANEPSMEELDAQVDAMLAKTEQILKASSDMISEFYSHAPEVQAWGAWFTRLSESHKQIVEFCGHNGIKATPENFNAILEQIAEAEG